MLSGIPSTILTTVTRPVGPLSFNITGGLGPYQVSKTSANTGVVPPSLILVNLDPGNFTVLFGHASPGQSVLTFTVTDSIGSVSPDIVVAVTINRKPTLSLPLH